MDTGMADSESTSQSLGRRISDVGRELGDAFEELVAALPEQVRRPQDLARALRVDKNVAHRLVTAIRKGDPLATVHAIPGPEPLRRVTAAARLRDVPGPIAERTERAIQVFESIIDEGGDRAGLDAIISTWLPDARRRFEKLAKQSLYRGARQVKGLSADLSFAAHMIHPSAKPSWCDVVDVYGYMGLRRIRPEASLCLGLSCGSSNMEAASQAVSGDPIEDPHQVLWAEYCSDSAVRLNVHHIAVSNEHVYELRWDDAVGMSSARDVVVRESISEAIRMFRDPDTEVKRAAIEECVSVPSKAMVFDVLLHDDVYPDWQPQVRVMEGGSRRYIHPNDPASDFDVLPLLERVESLGSGVERFRVEEIPRYVEMLAEVCTIRGWDPQSFRGYRARIEYPVFSSRIQLLIDLPLPPDSV